MDGKRTGKQTLPINKPGIFVRFLSFFLRVFFDLLYHQMAWTYDLVAAIVSLGQWKDWVHTAIPDLTGPAVLELGHGPGHLQQSLKRAGLRVFGLDRSRQMGHIAARRLKHADMPSSLVNGIAQKLPFPPGAFQQIVATFPTEYIADPLTLAEIYRVLAPGGVFVTIPVAWIGEDNWLNKAAAWLFRVTGQAGEWDAAYLEPLHETGFTTNVEFREVRKSTVLVVLATK
jgi:ubiquinone/menaquinone biosynthesis C-methylase UbiE